MWAEVGRAWHTRSVMPAVRPYLDGALSAVLTGSPTPSRYDAALVGEDHDLDPVPELQLDGALGLRVGTVAPLRRPATNPGGPRPGPDRSGPGAVIRAARTPVSAG
jgi:hypothetical protein